MSYTKCTIQEGSSSIHAPFYISYIAICAVRTAEFNNYHTPSGCTTKPFGQQSVDGLPLVSVEKLDVVHQVYDPRVGLKCTCTLSKLAIQLSVQNLQLNLIIIILPVGVQLSPLVCSLLIGSISVCEKLDVVHQVYDPRGGLKYTCTLQN